MGDSSMNSDQAHAPSSGNGETSGRITNWRDFEDRVKAAMAMAAAQPADITLVDSGDFGHWPLGQRSVMEAFHQWVLASRGSQCRLLAAHYEGFARHHPLWVAWRVRWSHRVQCHQAPEDLAPTLAPILVLHGAIALRVMEPLHGTGIWTREAGRITEWLSEIDVILQRSEPAMPSTTLGL